MTETTTPAGWYRDAQMPGQMRYWDGGAWTAHVAPIAGAQAPAPAPAKNRSGATVTLVIVGIVLATLMIVGILAAIAIPVFLNQRSNAQAVAVRADAAALGSQVAASSVEFMEYPDVWFDNGVYVLSFADGGSIEVPASDGVTLALYAVSDTDVCVATALADDPQVTAHFTLSMGVADGPCPEWQALAQDTGPAQHS